MEWIGILVGVLFALIGLVCIFIIVVGLPGTWIMIGLALMIELADRWYLPEGSRQTFQWWILGICILLGAVGELLELFAGVLGAKKGGSSRRGMIGSFIGGILGAIFGVVIPPPLIGSLIGALIGTFAGALIGELGGPESKKVGDTLRPATTATIGRVIGTLSKLPVAVAVWIILVVAAFW